MADHDQDRHQDRDISPHQRPSSLPISHTSSTLQPPRDVGSHRQPSGSHSFHTGDDALGLGIVGASESVTAASASASASPAADVPSQRPAAVPLSHTPTTTTNTAPARNSHHAPAENRLSGVHRAHKHHNRSSGGFLLADSLTAANRLGLGSTRRREQEIHTHAHTHTHTHTHTPEKRQRRSFEPVQGYNDITAAGAGVGGVTDSSSVPSLEVEGGMDAVAMARPSSQFTTAEAGSGATTVTYRNSFGGDTAVGSSSPAASVAQLDMESAQIVNMALNLSESRRLASRRNVSQPTPPRLAPLPDTGHGGGGGGGPQGGSLRYHLQQQRKMSRTVSPKPDRALSVASPRVVSGRLFTPLQPAFETGVGYRYLSSASTLARVQKAKEYLDLMAQYRRVLELVPPLEPEHLGRSRAGGAGAGASTTASNATIATTNATTPPLTPNNNSTSGSRTAANESEPRVIGRPYNPLQYIRNRKVRARERRAIDGEAQGFTDVLKVSEWVDDVAKWVATGQGRRSSASADGDHHRSGIPAFPGAQLEGMQVSPPPSTSASTSRAGSATKPKRPRVDWVINPADMLADVYWLELDDNKKLVEDRHWRRVFPQGQGLDVPRPSSKDETARFATPGSTRASLEAYTLSDHKTISTTGTITTTATGDQVQPSLSSSNKHDHEHVLIAARDRAQQKLRALKGSHHRHTSSFANRDLLRLHRGSVSESSDTDSDRRRRGGKGGPGMTTTVRSVLEKQMEEMIAREQREAAESHPLFDRETGRMRFTSPMTPDREGREGGRDRNGGDTDRDPRGSDGTLDWPPQRGSRTELSEVDSKASSSVRRDMLTTSPPSRRGRASLEVPRDRHASADDDDTSQAGSPNLRPTPDVIPLVPALGGMDFSPISSRAGSPHRNPLTRVKGMFRERSKDRSAETLSPQQYQYHNGGDDNNGAALITMADGLVATPETAGSGISSPHRRRPSRSPISGGGGDRPPLGHRSHKSLSSVKQQQQRSDDGNGLSSSFRSFLRGGPRIDTVLRSSVSKMSDMLWRKDGDDSSGTSSSSSDSEAGLRPGLRVGAGRAETRGRSRGPRHKRSYSVLEGRKALLDAPQFVRDQFRRSAGVDAGAGSGSGAGGTGASRSRGASQGSFQHPPARPISRRSSRFDLLKPPRIDVQNASPSISPPPAEVRQQQHNKDRKKQRADGGGSDTEPESQSQSQVAGKTTANNNLTRAATARLDAALAIPHRPIGPSGRPWSIADRGSVFPSTGVTAVSKREIARLRALLLSSGIHAMEMDRRAKTRKLNPTPGVVVPLWATNTNRNPTADTKKTSNNPTTNTTTTNNNTTDPPLTWPLIASHAPDPTTHTRLLTTPLAQTELYPIAARTLAASVQTSTASAHTHATHFASTTAPSLHARADTLRSRVAFDLTSLAQETIDAADGANHDLVAGQRLKVKSVVDAMETMLRRRRRRFRWVRRAGWLVVEWVLVGCMWYVWFMVVLARVVMGVGRGVVGGVRWLLWL
ncbi:hypothetical protein B0J18DRAFT_4065 [Chaetomium sp. MPI-SDFR-AT-0129]|nr:hypothetical protein B0J18DRAFT_4065 [Chaetomium sp. MPI-SDFR-AT-0129]